MLNPKKNPQTPKRLILASNRLPISFARNGGKWQVTSSSGGLVTAMGPVLRNRGGLWIGWPGTADRAGLARQVEAEQEAIGFQLSPIMLTQEEERNFYVGFSNEIIWPLFHSLQSRCNYDPDYWSTYERVNLKFAHSIAASASSDDYLWIHDYHLMSAGRMLRELGVDSPLGFFLHIPFPSADIFRKLPWRLQVLQSLLEFDLLGFQTAHHKRNFLQCVRSMIKDVAIIGKGPLQQVVLGGRSVRVGYFPIGIDYRSFSVNATAPGVQKLRAELDEAYPGCKKILGVDRLDYTKGLPYKLEAFRRALQRHPELRGKITLIQVVVPSREDIPEYHDLKVDIDRLVGEINGQLARPGWLPIEYMFRSLSRDQLLAYYQACEIALVTPLDDGMNLVAKEYCAATDAANGILILSEFAGAAAQLRAGALLVNPYDMEGVADAIRDAFNMSEDEARFRMRRMQRILRENDIFRWVDSFLQAGIARDLESYPADLVASTQQVDDSWWWEQG